MQIGEILAGKYKIVKQLGEGGEGSVFLAIHLQTEIFWAIKEIRMGQEEAEISCCHELQMMKSLRNRHLPQIIDVIREKNQVYLVMEHVRGIPMDKKIQEGRTLSEAEVRDTAFQAAEALCYLEDREHPICHLDIKPSNLILRPDGLIKLVDFGSAWKEKEQMKRMVTDGYAAPEQYMKDGPRPDARTDIYGLGATLYRMISGKKWSLSQRPESIPNCSAEMSELIFRCLRKRPEDRFQSASSLMESLERMGKKQRWEKGRIQILGAVSMALLSIALCAQILPSAFDLSADESWDYDKLVREAGVVSVEKSRDYYRKAIFMDPERNDAYLRYLSDVQIDGTLSDEEEIFLRDTLHTVRPGSDLTYEELLSADPLSYAETALQIALAYWYSFPGDNGRRIAIGWFEKASEAAGKAGEKTGVSGQTGEEPEATGKAAEKNGESGQTGDESVAAENAGGGPEDPNVTVDLKKRAGEIGEKAELYLRLGNILEKIHSPDEEQVTVNASEYWENLSVILSGTGTSEELKDSLTQLKLIRDALGTVAFLSGDLERAGIGSEEQTERIRTMMELAQGVKVPDEQAQIGRSIREEIRVSGENALSAAQNLRNLKETESEK